MSRAAVDALRERLAARDPDAPLEARRAGFEAMCARFAIAPDVTIEPWSAGADLTGLSVRAPDASAQRTILWLHGGQFAIGSPQAYRAFAAQVSSASGARVVALGYPLAPEHPFPAALDCARAAAAHLAASGEAFAIGGDSAGANLALAALQAEPDAAHVCRAIWLLSPYLDLTHSGASIPHRAPRDPFVEPSGMAAVAARYLAGADPADPRASPLFGAVSGLPPMLIQVGADEALFDDAARLAERVRAAGGEVVFQEWIDMIHVFPLFHEWIEEGGWAIRQAGAFLGARTSRTC